MMPQPCNAKSRTPKAHSEGFALSQLPIEVPYHSVIGQRRPGPRERGSDGVVPYWSSHLDGAQSEVIVRSGHGVFSNPEAVQEVIRILHLASRGKLINSDVSARAGRIVSQKRPRQKGRDGVEEKSAVLGFLLVCRGMASFSVGWKRREGAN
jgi:hypothetical protein